MEIRTTQGAAHSKVIGAMAWTSKSLLVRRGFHEREFLQFLHESGGTLCTIAAMAPVGIGSP